MNNDTLEEAKRAIELAEKGWYEIWKDIPNYPGYQVSDFGNVRSRLRHGNYKEKLSDSWRILKKQTSTNGYKTISLRGLEDKYKHIPIHHLVAFAFIGPRPEGLHIAHLNGDRTDNRKVNLSYCTPKENNSHKSLHGTAGMGEKNSMATRPLWIIEEIKYLAEKSIPHGKIAKLFDIPHTQISAIVAGRAWPQAHARLDLPKLAQAVIDLNSDMQTLSGNFDSNEKECNRYQKIAIDLARKLKIAEEELSMKTREFMEKHFVYIGEL